MSEKKTEQNTFRQAIALKKAGKISDALDIIQNALRRDLLNASEIDRAGRFIQNALPIDGLKASPRIFILGQCTSTWLVTTLTAISWGRMLPLEVYEKNYDNVLQDLIEAINISDKPYIIILLPWTQRLLRINEQSMQKRIEDEIMFWSQCWSLVQQLSARLIQISYDWITPGPMGYSLGLTEQGVVSTIRTLNQRLREELPAGAYFIDLEQISGQRGRTQFYDTRRYFWTKQPFSEEGVAHLAEHCFAGARTLLHGPKKVLVLDLDNTLWGGVVGEVGPQGIELAGSVNGEAHLAVQSYAKQLMDRGILLAVCSKNNLADAQEPFKKNTDMILQLEDFAAFEASWDPKAVGLKKIAQTLRLGLDSFVFLDDNPAEREHIRQALPEVEVVDLTNDPSEYVSFLENGLWFEAINLTKEDQKRSQQYRIEAERRALLDDIGSLDQYLESLAMEAEVKPLDDQDMSRVLQMIVKTNQFNLTTRRHNHEVLTALWASKDGIALTLRMNDRFGEYGLVSFILGVPLADEANKVINIDTWLMSCRVIGRTVEHFLFNHFLNQAKALGYHKIVGEYLPTKKNALVSKLYDTFGFEKISTFREGHIRYQIDLTKTKPQKAFIRLKSENK